MRVPRSLAVRLVLIALSATLWLGSGSVAVAAPSHSLISFTSNLYPYRMGYPSGWKHTVQKSGGLSADAFFAPRGKLGFDDNANVFAQTDTSHRSDAQLLAMNIAATHQQLRIKPRRLGTVNVFRHHIGLIAYAMPFSAGASVVRLNVTQAMAHIGSRDWYFTLTTREGDELKVRPTFVAMLETFSVR